MAKRKGRQKGAQQHAEGQHGSRTHAAFIDSIQHKQPGSNAWAAEHRGDAAGEPDGSASRDKDSARER